MYTGEKDERTGDFDNDTRASIAALSHLVNGLSSPILSPSFTPQKFPFGMP